METPFVEVGKGVVNVTAVAEAHIEGDKLFVHFIGGAFQSYWGADAKLLYLAISERAVNLLTGEVKSKA